MHIASLSPLGIVAAVMFVWAIVAIACAVVIARGATHRRPIDSGFHLSRGRRAA